MCISHLKVELKKDVCEVECSLFFSKIVPCRAVPKRNIERPEDYPRSLIRSWLPRALGHLVDADGQGGEYSGCRLDEGQKEDSLG